jgi:GNAT superfamily N-acetyltransferase
MPPFAHCEVTDCFELTGGSLALADPAASLAFARRLLAQPRAAIPSLAEETPPIVLRALDSADSDVISRAFAAMGWNKPAEQYRRYLDEQASGERSVIVAERGGEFAGYATVRWSSSYEPFVRAGIPEIEDLNVVNRHRRHGVATALLDEAEARIAVRSRTAGIGVGLHPGYNAAQRLYGLRGYVPDGRGVTYENRAVAEGELAMFDDALVLRLTKAL